MATNDLSRSAYYPRKRFSGVRMQQGRVLTDDDFNEQEQIIHEDKRLSIKDVIGTAGSPDAGFSISKVDDSDGVDFTINAGTFYLGGLRAALADDQKFKLQADWLQKPTVMAPNDERHDMVYLEVWQQSVSVVEDEELYEKALGGPDTTTRRRTMFRVKLVEDVGTNLCPEAWGQVVTAIESIVGGKMINNHKLLSDARLTVGYEQEDNGEDLCSPSVLAGYLGAENQAIRVQLTDKDHFTWGFDNGAPLYRVTLEDAASVRKTFKLVTEPKDQAHWPQAGQIVEIMPWSAVLENGEKLAEELSPGHFSSISDSYDPDSGEITLTIALPPNFCEQWQSRNDANKLRTTRFGSETVESEYFFLRVWNRGAGDTSDPIIAVGTEIKLGKTGLNVSIRGNQRLPGDHWIIAARPHTPDQVVPWQLEVGRSPEGYQRFYAPLAIIHWNAAGANEPMVYDCRRTFPHLVDIPTSFCTIAVEPGRDIHEALTEIIKRGGGCICLLPGNHILRGPIDLSNLSGIHFKGFGSLSRLYIATQLKGSAPFILSTSRDISFDSFAIFNRTANPVWSCQQTMNLTIENMIASTTLVKGKQKLISIAGNQCHHWRLENNVFSGPVIIGGALLSDSLICNNVFQGVYRGIDLRYMQRSTILRNRFSSLHRKMIMDYEFDVNDILNKDDIRNRHLANIALKPFLPTKKLEVAPDYVGVDVSWVFEVDIIDNHFTGSVGMDCELLENVKIHSNDFITTVTGASCGLLHGLRFSENRIGFKDVGQTKEKDVQCRVGLVILADAVNCQVINNSFANVQEGILFESDITGKKAISRDFSVNLLAMENVTKEMAELAMAESSARVKERIEKQLLLNSTFFRIGKCEHTLIQGNQFNASETAIEWSGTKNIVDFRIVNNSFIGCQDVAIQIEPDDRIFFLADPVDTKVRLIEKNRFEIYSGAVRATIGAVRIEKNDIRIKAPLKVLVPPIDFIVAAADNVYKLAPFTEAAEKNDIPMMRMAVTEATNLIEKNPGGIDSVGYSKTLENTILKNYAPKKGDILADKSFVMKTIADIGEINFIAPLLNTGTIKLQVSMEGFAVNLSGIQNRAVHNRIHSSNNSRPGGIVFHVVSGEIRDNEVSVPGTALLLNGKIGLSAAYQGVEIVGNSLIAAGIPGDNKAIYALAIPSLSPGNISITGNQFRGSVMVGGDPISAQGFTKKEKFEVPKKVIFYNMIKYDLPTYTMAALNKAFPAKKGTFGQITPPITVIPIWLLDPHANRPVVQFSNNRVIQGWVGIFQALSGAYWSKALLEKQGHKALVANVNGNVIDYGGSIVGYDVIMVANQSQIAFKYRAGRESETVANIPPPQSF